MNPAVEHYNRVTQAWSLLMGDNLHYGCFDEPGAALADATEALTQRMLQALGAQRGATVLDVGCGSGRAACRLAAELDCGVTGISPSEASVAASRQRAQAAGLESRASFCLGDGQQLAFADTSMDAVWIMESSHLMLDKPALVREASRVLRPGGKLVLCDVMATRPLGMSDVIRWRDEFLLLQQGFGRARMEPLDYYSELLFAQGLEVFLCEDLSALTRPTFSHWRANALSNRAAVETLIGADGWQVFFDACAVLESLWDEPLLGYGLIAAQRPA